MVDALRPLALVLTLLLAAAPPAFGQGAEFGATKAQKAKNASKAKGGDNFDSQEGLESATPTDNVNELNGNGAPAAKDGGNNEVDDFPATDDSKSFDINSSNANATGGNSLFGDAPDAKPDAKPPANSAFGSGANNAAKPAAPAPAAAPVVNAAPPPTVNANAKAPDAEALMNQANTPPANAAPAAGPKPAAAATGQVDLAPKVPPAPPEIVAPPLPPPNEFSGAPPVPGTMRLMAEGEAPEEYLVQSGDTLFDICDQLLDEAGYWPKLWALNPEIKNPHFIFPNMRLRFYPGDDDNPPYLQVVTEDDVIPIDKGDLDEQDLIAEKVIFPTDAAGAEAAATEVIGPEGVDALQDAILLGGKRYDGSEVQVHVPGFIYGDEKEPLGFVIGGRSGNISLGPTAEALVESSGELAAGTLYTVLRKGEAVSSPESGDAVGYKYYFVGNVRIERDIGDDVFVGQVQDSRLSILPDDVVVSFISTKRSVPINGAVGSLGAVSAFVVGFEYDKQEVGGHGNFAFIDKGTGDGVAPGMYLAIYATPGYLTSAFGSSDLPVDYEKVGVIRIIDTTDAGSVGYIIRNKQELRIGDRTNKS